jgi:hypothetical protein
VNCRINFFVPASGIVRMLDRAKFRPKQARSTVLLPAHSLITNTGETIIPAQKVALKPVGTQAVVGLPSVLRRSNRAAAQTFLTHADVSELIVRTGSDGTGSMLAEHSDFDVSPLGRMRGLKPELDQVPIHLSYLGHNRRYDVIYVDPVTATLGVARGRERGLDPEHYFGPVPTGAIALYHVLLCREGAELIPVCDFHDFERHGEEASWAALEARNREAIGAFLHRCEQAANGAPAPKLILYGDSTQALGGVAWPDQNMIANGLHKDSTKYFSRRMPKDTIAQLRIFRKSSDPDFSTYQGDDGTAHIKVGAAWRFKAAVDHYYGIRLPLENRAWSATNSMATIRVNGVDYEQDPGGWNPRGDDVRCGALWPERLAALLDSIELGDLVIWGMGTNERGKPYTYDNTVRAIRSVQSRGGVVLVNGCRLPSADCGRMGIAETNEQLRRAAEDTGSAFSPIDRIEAPGHEGACGLAPRSFGNDNYHHPAIAQLVYEGLLMAKVCGFARVDADWNACEGIWRG